MAGNSVGPDWMKSRFFIFVAILAAGLVGFIVWWRFSLSPVSSDKNTRTFVVEKGDGVKEVSVRLKEANLIHSRIAFFLLERFFAKNSLQAGSFKLSPAMTAEEISNKLTVGTEDVWITIPEGWRNEEIADYLFGLGFVGDSVVGRLFPDTYLVPKEATVEGIVALMAKNFNTKVTFPVTNDQLIVASMVEREARVDADRPLVASVIYNRLEAGMALDIDATVQYALGYWKKDLTMDDLKINSPYNTYQNAGLPPGPICNPGLASIRAAVTPAKTDYLYYISDKTGKIHFATTLEEHNANVAKYL